MRSGERRGNGEGVEVRAGSQCQGDEKDKRDGQEGDIKRPWRERRHECTLSFEVGGRRIVGGVAWYKLALLLRKGIFISLCTSPRERRLIIMKNSHSEYG